MRNAEAEPLLRRLFAAALAVADPARCLPPHIPAPPPGKTIVIGAGKAAAAMANALERHWPGQPGQPGKLSGFVVTRYGHGLPCQSIEVIEAAHPVPDAAGAAAARRALLAVDGLGQDDMVLVLLSGGGSALLAAPAPGITLADKQAVTRALLASGASIHEINCVRKHLSAIKGGRLAVAAWPARVVTLAISDVPGDDPATIASGPTVADPTTCAEAEEILTRYAIDVPDDVRALLRTAAAETPKPGSLRLKQSEYRVIATAQQALSAAAMCAREVGVTPLILGDAIEGESREVARAMAGIALSCARHATPLPLPCVLLSGGETTVTLRPQHHAGRGGRNAEFLLALALAVNGHPAIHAIACDTDGIDGSEDNAGAIITPDTLLRAEAAGVDARAKLADNDAYGFFATLNDLVMTGPTRTNVNDFRAILIARQEPAGASMSQQRQHNAAQEQDFSDVDRTALLAELSGLLPAQALLTDPEELKPYECDALTAYRRLPLAVVLAEDEAQVIAVLRVCHRLGVPVVARGAGTGLSGGALPHPHGVLLSLAKMKKICHLDPVARLAVVQPGVRNLAISEAAAAYGLYYAPDPSSQIACSIGGNVAENAGGVHCLKYGLTLHNILRARVVTIAGEVIELGNHALDAPGLDLLALAIGSEGLLAVVTEITVRLTPKPAMAQVILASFNAIEAAGEAVAAIIAAGIIPAGLEMMDKQATAAVEPYVHAGYDLNAEAILLCESDGTLEEVAEEIAAMRAVLERHGASSLRISQSEAERLKFWAGRKAAFPAVGRLSPDYYCMDGTIPKKRLAEMLRAIAAMEQKYQLRCANVFHAGDGNLHPLIMYDAAKPGELERTEAFGAEILALSVKLGGTITGEHGVGFEKIGAMCVQFSADELTVFHQVKAAFDPQGLLNPGKAVPSLTRCAEVGGMHVHHGQLPFPELERF